MSTEDIIFRRHAKGGEDVDDKFDIDVSKKQKIILFAVLGILIIFELVYPTIDDGQGDSLVLEWWAPFVFLLLTVPVIFLWGKIGPTIAQKFILSWLKKTSAKKITTPVEFFVGFPFAVKDTYYIEANPMDFEITKPAYLISRIQEVTFLAIGISVIISQFVVGSGASFIQAQFDAYGYISDSEIIIYSAIFLGPFALLALFFIMPMFWIGEDMQIYRIDALQDTHRLGLYFRTSVLSKILGFFGIVLAFNTANDFANVYYAGEASTVIYMWTFIYFIFILLGCAIPPYLISLCYLVFFHKEWVNTTRIKASEFLPCGTTVVHKAPPSELEYLTHPEKLAEFDRPDITDKPAGKAIIFGLCIVSAVLSFLISFVFIF